MIWFFITGATVAVTDPFYKWWSNLPATKEPVTIRFGMIALNAVVLIVCFVFFFLQQKRKFENERNTFGSLESSSAAGHPKTFRDTGRWRFFCDIVLAFCVLMFCICVGSTIGIMGIFSLIGSKFLHACGVNVEKWVYWNNSKQWQSGIRNSAIFYSDLFIIAGSLLASAIFKKFGKSQKNSLVEFVKAIFGGLLMGLGGKMASGCNIGSMLSGINSGSLHGWVWMTCAMLGSAVVIYGQKLIERLITKPKPDDFEALPN